MPSILDYLRQPEGALAPALGGDPAFAAEMAQLRQMTPEQLRAQSLREQDLQRRSALLGQRGPIHYGGLPQGMVMNPRPQVFGLDQLGQSIASLYSRFGSANASPR